MPEGDAVYRFARLIEGALLGKEIRAARAQGPGPVPKTQLLVGATCTSIDTYGKNLLIHFDNGLVLRGHLRMYGAWFVYKPGETWDRHPAQARLVLEVDDAVVVNFSAPVIELLEERALGFHAPLAKLGPDLLDEGFNEAEAFARFREPALARLTLGDAIMDQKVMAGVGNIWKQETLFRCRLNPWLRVGDLSDEDLRLIIQTARGLLRASTGKENSLGLKRRPTMFVYMRGGQPCPNCHARLRSSPQGEDIRHTAWCPQCQPERENQAVTAQPRVRLRR